MPATKERDPVRIVEHDLQSEFRDLLPPEAIARLAEEEVGSFRAAPVREFVPVLAWRRARSRARDLLSAGNGR